MKRADDDFRPRELYTDAELDSYDGGLGGLTRRQFFTYCSGIAATMGLSSAAGIRMAEAATAAERPPVIWLHGQECTGCTETLLRSTHPTLESLILDMISLEYHETLCAGAGTQAEAHKHKIMEEQRGKYVLVTEGALPTKDGAGAPGLYLQSQPAPPADAPCPARRAVRLQPRRLRPAVRSGTILERIQHPAALADEPELGDVRGRDLHDDLHRRHLGRVLAGLPRPAGAGKAARVASALHVRHHRPGRGPADHAPVVLRVRFAGDGLPALASLVYDPVAASVSADGGCHGLQRGDPGVDPGHQSLRPAIGAWYEGGDQARHPWDGQTNPSYTDFQVQGKYSWVKSPTFYDKRAQVGPLANVLAMYISGHESTKRHADRLLAIASKVAGSPIPLDALQSTIGRTAARAVRAAVLYDALQNQWQLLMDNIAKGDFDTYNRPIFQKGEIRGFGFHEAPRGTLSLWTVIEDGKIKNYQAVVPTTWNAGPRDVDDRLGPYEASLLDNPVADSELPLEVLRTVHSFDPCLACAIHMVDERHQPIVRVRTH